MDMEFDSKFYVTPPTILLGLLLCPWTWDVFFFFFFFGATQHFVNGYSAVSCNFGVLNGED